MPWWQAGAIVAGALISSNASRRAASTAADSAADARTETKRQYDITREDQKPFMQTGVAANARLASMLAPGGELAQRFSASDMESDPVYQSGLKFGLDQGTGAINQRAIAGGSYDSGATLKALTRYANDYGSTKANESYNRFNNDQTNLYNRNAGVSGAGQVATNQVGAQGAQAAGQIGGYLTDAGSARSAGIIGGANAWGQGISSAVNNYQSNEWMKRLFPQEKTPSLWGRTPDRSNYSPDGYIGGGP